MKFIGMFERCGALPQFSDTRSRRRDMPGAPAGGLLARGFCSSVIAMAFASILLAGPVLAQDRPAPVPAQEAAHYAWADVLRVDPVYDDAVPTAAHEECYEEQVLDPAPAADAPDAGKHTGATFIGAIIGGIIGNHFGKGNGRVATTAAGAVAGGVVGNNVAASQQTAAAADAPKYTTQRHCRQVGGAGNQRRVIAYDVEYRYRGDVYSSRLTYDPGDRMRVRVSVTPAE
jgi:uncharacterized protein YcfJ